MKTPTLYIFSGLPGSGKTAWARRFYLWGTPFILIVNLALGDPNSMPRTQVWVLAGQIGLYAMWAFLLTRPRTMEFFK